MKLKEMEIPLTNISGIGPGLAKTFSRINVFTVADLLTYYPRDWEDRTQRRSLAEFSRGKVHTAAAVIAHEWFGFGRMKTLKIIITDGTERGALICFNRPFLQKTLTVGSIISVNGTFSYRYGEIQSSAFEAAPLVKKSLAEWKDKPLPDSRVFALYPLTAGLTQTQIRKAVSNALSEYAKGIEDEIPCHVRERHNLFSKQKAVYAIHKPENMEEALCAQKTLIFEELYLFQKKIIGRAAERRHGKYVSEQKKIYTKEELLPLLSPRQKQLAERLPFSLTKDQIASIALINADIDAAFVKPEALSGAREDSAQSTAPFYMARLLQGDVGSGKTLVAFFAALRTVDWGAQCALLAPTEILAKQHAENAARLMEPLIGGDGKGVRTAFLTGNVKNRGRIPLLQALQEGSIDIIIGTHALFSKNVLYYNLRLVIIDEQHRFGVVQRGTIIDKGRSSAVNQRQIKSGGAAHTPSLLMMSATPIPQTLAHTVYGDLDLTTIKTVPDGRKPIRTFLTKQGNEARVYEAVLEELKKGRQAYFVYPRIEDAFEEDGAESENGFAATGKPSLKSAEGMFAFLSRQVYPEFKCALIHSKTDDAEQSDILRLFGAGEIDVLVATSVVEVGVDAPNATAMVIEHAERFGLAALHQLRGRIGRGSEQSFCFLIYTERLSETGKERLKVMRESTDGFFIAEEDLRLRGPGEAAGIQQSGYLTLGIADPLRDRELAEAARREALQAFAAENSYFAENGLC
ncbi:ATP-dependent DNA helicase RecG [Treponema sp. HNW]|uniref:ATP-dependent DNA helicase RecG n=1 Tax=Treponema sp. HNW TaxID=3116654 RepID=UPI003D0CE9AF